jgi:AcrR family transcriptional regulator
MPRTPPRPAPRKRPAAARRPPPGRRALNKQRTRDRIVAAALGLFQSKGFEQTTTRAIARRARVAEGTVFNYFETKEDIALHFLELEVGHAIAAVRGNRRLARAPLEEKLFALLESQIAFLAPYERFIGAAFVQALKPASKLGWSRQAAELRLRYLAFVQELIEESLPRGKREHSALAWFGPPAFWVYYLGVLLYWLHDPSAGKQQTLAFIDRSLKFGIAVLRKGGVK